MKDALGHGSDPRGSSGGGNPVPPTGRGVHGRFLIQKLNTALVGNRWQTIKRAGRRAVAERVAQNLRVDNPDTLLRARVR